MCSLSHSVARNELSCLPEEIGSLSSLEELCVSENKLTSLPQSIGGLVSLKALSASRNRIEALRPSLFSLRNLVLLRLTDNLIEALPSDLLPNLVSLSLLFSKIKTNRSFAHVLLFVCALSGKEQAYRDSNHNQFTHRTCRN